MCLKGVEFMEGLDCSNCNNKIAVTWSRYWRSGFGSYYCPDCDTKLKFSTTPRWIQFSSWALQLTVSIICYHLIQKFGLVGAVSLFLLIPVFVFDKKLDTKFGSLTKAT
jgi:hypothetical protein